jgi:D-glycero-D-manno-heptose 1,7-bisphosphate phosphatase
VVGDKGPIIAARAVFLDRDGVINENVFYADTGELEAPRRAADYRPIPGAFAAMRRLEAAGFLLFIVSNQPNMAKAKATRDDHDAIHAAMQALLKTEGIDVKEAFYCFHHPKGVVPELSGRCDCRKPSPHFLLKAAERWTISLPKSWMVGDRGTDIACGVSARARTIRISTAHDEAADFCAANLAEAAEVILAKAENPPPERL